MFKGFECMFKSFEHKFRGFEHNFPLAEIILYSLYMYESRRSV